MRKAKLLFDNNGKTAHIEFANGRESLDFKNKEDAIFSIKDCYKRRLITKKEAKEFSSQIDRSKKMPSKRATKPSFNKVEFIDQDGHVLSVFKDLNVDTCQCEIKIPHAFFRDENCTIETPFLFKSDVREFIDSLFESGRINEEDRCRLDTKTKTLSLPESPECN